ncbi:MAG: Crp/Fnr family transcriptional regulator [Pseudomonadota bacterium]
MSERKDIHNSDIPVICRACEARHKGICGALTPDQLTKLSKQTQKTAVEPDSFLLEADQPVDMYSNILNGVVKLTKLMPDGRQQIVGLQFAPDFLGRPFQNDNAVFAEAANTVALCSFPKKALEDLAAESPDLEHRLHEQALRELDEARDLMLLLGRKTAGEKVASFLMLLIRHMDPEREITDGAVALELPLKRADIADFLGLTIETVSRQLTKLRKAHVIEVENNRTIHVPSLERLRAASGDF